MMAIDRKFRASGSGVALVAMFLLCGGCSGSGGSAAQPGASGNAAPTITGAPAAAIAIGQTYSFTPVAADPNGDRLTFSIQAQPAWADFDPSTGSLSGVPVAADVGNYAGIVITASDGKSSTSLPGFSVRVDLEPLGSVTLNWVAPTQNADGSPLHDLAAYNIYYGTTSGVYSDHVRVTDMSTTTVVIEDLPITTYYFVATSENDFGVESDFSVEAVKVAQ